MTSWPDFLEYPVEEIESVATFIVTDDGHVPDTVKAWALKALADVSDATAQIPLFGTHGGVEVDADWQALR